jgi:hypothetical protein
VLQRVYSNTFVVDLQLDFGISFTFNIEDLVAYRKPHYISNHPFEMSYNPPMMILLKPLPLSLGHPHKRIILMLF